MYYRKRRPGRKPRPFRNHMSRHSPIPFTETKPKVLEPVKPLMLDDVAYDANYDEINYEVSISINLFLASSLTLYSAKCSKTLTAAI
jgi:hypothetical protein